MGGRSDTIAWPDVHVVLWEEGHAVWSLRPRPNRFILASDEFALRRRESVSVTAMMATLAASSRVAPAKTLGQAVPEVDRLAVHIVTDNVVIQFVPAETRDGLTIERFSRGNLRARRAAT